jgi:hypothetical protein
MEHLTGGGRNIRSILSRDYVPDYVWSHPSDMGAVGERPPCFQLQDFD